MRRIRWEKESGVSGENALDGLVLSFTRLMSRSWLYIPVAL